MKAYTVLHLEKAKGNDTAISAHIERTVSPKNADENRSHLNKEYISFPENIKNRSEAIQYRIENAQLSRKVSHNQVRAIRIILSGSHEQMLKLESNQKIDDWVQENIKWLNDTFGNENVVSCVLHMDEKTPHLHGTVVPIVTGEGRKSKSEKEKSKKKYKIKDSTRNRLCADDLMNRQKLKFYQDSYAKEMYKFGLSRGIEGSTSRHISTSEYYSTIYKETEALEITNKELIRKAQILQENIQILQKEENLEKTKEKISNLFTGTKTKKLYEEISELKKDNEKFIKEIGHQKKNFSQKEINLKDEKKILENSYEKQIQKMDQKIIKLNEIINSLVLIDPLIIDKFGIMRDCRNFGLNNEEIALLFQDKSLLVNSGKFITSEVSPGPTEIRLLKSHDNKLNAYIGNNTLLYHNNLIKRELELKSGRISPSSKRQIF